MPTVMSREGKIPGADGFIPPALSFIRNVPQRVDKGLNGISVSFCRSPLFSRHVNKGSLYSHPEAYEPAFTTVYSVLVPYFCEVGTLDHNSFSNTEEEAETLGVEVTL